MQNDQLDGLLALKLVAEKKNFTAAARTLGISPSAVSQIIKQLEARVGITLLSRTTRSTNLTEAGEKFLQSAGPAIDLILASLEGIGSYAEKPAGLLRLNLPRSIYLVLAPKISSFLRKHPDITVELFFDDGLSDVVGDGFDAGIRLSEMMAKDVVAVNLTGPIRWVVAGSPGYFARVGRPKHPKDLLAHNCLRVRLGESEFYDNWEFEHKGKDFQVKVGGSLIMNDSILMVNAVKAGDGLMYYAEEFLRDHLKSKKLEVVLTQYAARSDGFYLYYPKRSQMLPKLRAFVDHLKSEK